VGYTQIPCLRIAIEQSILFAEVQKGLTYFTFGVIKVLMRKGGMMLIGRNNKLAFVLVSILVIFIAAGCKGKKSPTSMEEASWHEVESSVRLDLFSVFALSENDAWAVGECTTIIRWDGNEWAPTMNPTGCNARAIYSVSEDNVWAVGDEGMIIHWQGDSWNEDTTVVNATLYSLHFLSAVEGWAAGSLGVILHYYNDKWSIVYQDSMLVLEAIDFVSPEEGWAVGKRLPDGGDSRGIIIHYLNGNWTSEICYSPLYSVEFVSTNDGWAGYAEKGYHCILHYGGNEWKGHEGGDVFACTRSISFVNSTTGWAIDGGIREYKNGTWSRTSITVPLGCIFSCVSALNPEDVWAVGECGYILHYSK
jgi:photosystem II stability/assembly factor-like uncharacterized protein